MSKKLVVYASPIPATYLVGPAIAKFVSQYPQHQIELRTNDQAEFFKTSQSRSFDLGIFDISSYKNSKQFDCEFLLNSTASLCCRKDHPLLSQKTVLAKDVLLYPLATPVALQDYVTHELNRILELPIEEGKCRVNLNYDSLVTVRHALKESDMIALAPSLALTHSLSHELQALDIKDWPLIEAEFGIVTKRSQALPEYITSFIEMLFEVAERIKSEV